MISWVVAVAPPSCAFPQSIEMRVFARRTQHSESPSEVYVTLFPVHVSFLRLWGWWPQDTSRSQPICPSFFQESYLASRLEAASSFSCVFVIEATARGSILLQLQFRKCLSSRRLVLVGFGVTMRPKILWPETWLFSCRSLSRGWAWNIRDDDIGLAATGIELLMVLLLTWSNPIDPWCWLVNSFVNSLQTRWLTWVHSAFVGQHSSLAVSYGFLLLIPPPLVAWSS